MTTTLVYCQLCWIPTPASNAEGSCDDFLDVGRRFDGTVVAIAIAIAIAAAVAVATHLLHSVELRCILAC